MTDSTEDLPLPNALAFAGRGYSELPLHGIIEGKCTCGNLKCESPGKHPYARFAPHGLKDATTDPDTIRQWFEEVPFINYGVCTDNLPVIDIDPRNGGDKKWLELVRKNYDVHTWRVHTGGGGQHIMFGPTEKPLRSAKLAPGVDFQAAGKYIVGAGSMHISGRRYTWAPQCHPREVGELKAVPSWVLDLASTVCNLDTRRPTDHWRKIILNGADEGCRNATAASLAGHCLRCGLSALETYEFVCTWNTRNRPPLAEDELEIVVKSIAQRELRRCSA